MKPQEVKWWVHAILMDFLTKQNKKEWLHTYNVPVMNRQTRPSGGFQSSEGVGCGQRASTLTECDHRARRGSWEENTPYSELCGSKVRWKRGGLKVAFV